MLVLISKGGNLNYETLLLTYESLIVFLKSFWVQTELYIAELVREFTVEICPMFCTGNVFLLVSVGEVFC